MKKRYAFFSQNRIHCGLFLAVFFFFSLTLQAQISLVKHWDKTIGGSGHEGYFGMSLQQTSDGGFILGGGSNSDISGDKTQANKGPAETYDFWVVKLDASGNKTWDKVFGGNESESLQSLQQTADGGYILGGYSSSGISGDKSQACISWYDYWVVKLDASGNKLWDKTYGGFRHDILSSVKQTSDGGFIIGGISDSGIGGNKSQACRGYEDYWVVKLDANGNKIWDRTFGGNDKDELYALQQTSDGGYILGGWSISEISGDKSLPNKGGGEYWLLKLDASGNKTWDKTFGGSNADVLQSLQQTSDGGYILGGTSGSDINGDKSQDSKGWLDYWVIKLDANGNKTWDKTLGGGESEYLASIRQTSDGGYIMGGWSPSGIGGDKSEACQGDEDFWVVKLDASGNKTWDKTFGGSGTDRLYSLQQTSDEGYILGGWSRSGISSDKSQACKGNDDLWVIKLAAPCPENPVVTPGRNCGAGSVKLYATGAPTGWNYVWYDVAAGGTPLYTSPSGTFTTPEINTTTIYYVAAITNAGCEGPRTPATATIATCPPPFIPNIITRNQDGRNDTFKPQYLPEGKWQLQVFNRWGKKLFESEDYQNNWPEKKISDGTYYYLLRNPETGKQFKGWVEVFQ